MRLSPGGPTTGQWICLESREAHASLQLVLSAEPQGPGPGSLRQPRASQRSTHALQVSTRGGTRMSEAGGSSRNQVRPCAAARSPSTGLREHRLPCADRASLPGRVNVLQGGWDTPHSQQKTNGLDL